MKRLIKAVRHYIAMCVTFSCGNVFLFVIIDKYGQIALPVFTAGVISAWACYYVSYQILMAGWK